MTRKYHGRKKLAGHRKVVAYGEAVPIIRRHYDSLVIKVLDKQLARKAVK
jgi:hypothetical protein